MTLADFWRVDLHVAWQAQEHVNLYLNTANLFDRDNHLPSIWNAENGYEDTPLRLTIGCRISF